MERAFSPVRIYSSHTWGHWPCKSISQSAKFTSIAPKAQDIPAWGEAPGGRGHVRYRLKVRPITTEKKDFDCQSHDQYDKDSSGRAGRDSREHPPHAIPIRVVVHYGRESRAGRILPAAPGIDARWAPPLTWAAGVATARIPCASPSHHHYSE